MCAVRFGSYSIAATRPGTPSLVRLKSMRRYRRFAPPPRWREVMRPCVLRPPDLRRPSVRLRSGSFFASSGFCAQVAKRRPGEVGLWRLMGISQPPPNDPKTEQSKDAGSKACASKARPEDAGMRRFAGSFADLLALEELYVVVRMELDDRLLPLARLARGVAAALGLRLHAHRVDAEHTHAEDLFHRLADLGLVGALVDAERVLVGREQLVALLGDDRPDQDAAGVHAATSSRSLRAICVR